MRFALAQSAAAAGPINAAGRAVAQTQRAGAADAAATAGYGGSAAAVPQESVDERV